MADAKVRDIMQRDVVTVAPSDDVESLIRLLREHELPGVPVVDGRQRLVGIVTESDLILRAEDAELHLPHYLELFGGIVFLEPLKHLEEKLRKAFATRVSDMMTRDVLTIRPAATVSEAARLISSSGHNRLPVTEGDQMVGIVTRIDCLQALTAEE